MAAYALTVLEEHGARSGLAEFIETVHSAMSAVMRRVCRSGDERDRGTQRRHHSVDPRAQRD